jgi:hypothetical protein
MAGKKKAGISQNADLPDISLPNSTEQALRAGAKVRQSLERKERAENELTNDLAELVVCALPHLHHYRRLVDDGLEKKVMVHLAKVGCPSGEYRHHPTGAARDRLAFSVLRINVYPNQGGKLPREKNSKISRAAAALAYLADDGVTDEDKAREIFKEKSIYDLAESYSATKNKPKPKDKKSVDSVKNSPQKKNEENNSEGLSGPVGGSEPVQAGPPTPAEAPQSTLPSGGASGVVHGGQLDTTEATIEGSIGPKDKRADYSGGRKRPILNPSP